MINFDFFTPTKILFGAGRESEVGKQVAAFGGHKVMIIYGKKGGHIETSGLLDRFKRRCAQSSPFSGKRGDPHWTGGRC